MPTVAAQALSEVAGSVEQADPDDGNAEIASGLQVIAGQDAQPSRVLRQGRGHSVLRGEVGDTGERCGLGVALAAPLKPVRGTEVGVQIRNSSVDPLHEGGIRAQLGESISRYLAEQSHRITPAPMPQLRVHRCEQVGRLRMPGPAEVEREFL